MELIIHLLLLAHSIDYRWLRPLGKCVPEYAEILASPEKELKDREIEIGPWKRPVKAYGLPLLLLAPLWIAAVAIDSVLATVGLTLAWLVVSQLLMSSARGGSCFIRADAVEFRYRGISVVCPWDLFHAAGQAVYHAELHELDLPVDAAAKELVQAWKEDRLLLDSWQKQASHFFRFLASAELRLRWVYGVNPLELGDFLLQLGRKLGKPAADATEFVSSSAPGISSAAAPAALTGDGWICVSLTRLVFPPLCCGCGQATSQCQQFVGYPSLFSTNFSVAGSGPVVIEAPVCDTCRSSNRRHYWRQWLLVSSLWVVGWTVLGLIIGAVLDGLGPGNGAMTAILTCTGMIVGLGLSWFVADKVARQSAAPLSLRDYRPGDGTIQINFRNREYARNFLTSARS